MVSHWDHHTAHRARQRITQVSTHLSIQRLMRNLSKTNSTTRSYQTRLRRVYKTKSNYYNSTMQREHSPCSLISPKHNFVANISKLIHVLNYFRNDFLALQLNSHNQCWNNTKSFSNKISKYDQGTQMQTSAAPRCINRTLGVQYHTTYQNS